MYLFQKRLIDHIMLKTMILTSIIIENGSSLNLYELFFFSSSFTFYAELEL